MKTLISAVLTWFFSVSTEIAPGVGAVTFIAPFSTRAECMAFKQSMEDKFEAFGVPATFSQCNERKSV
jgi:hypothetical protein